MSGKCGYCFLIHTFWNDFGAPGPSNISMLYAPRVQSPFEKMAAWSQGLECFKGPGIHCGGRCPYGTPAARNFRHIGGTPWKSNGGISQMFCRKDTEHVEFRRIEVEGMPDSKVGSAKTVSKRS
jgi:hypothetical protein